MECSCAIDPCYDCDEPGIQTGPEMVESEVAETCTECASPILPGTRHEHITFTYQPYTSGETVEVYRTCLDCLSLRRHFFCSFGYGCLWEDFRQHVQEFLEEFPYALLAELTPAAREAACEIIEDEWSEQFDEEEAA